MTKCSLDKNAQEMSDLKYIIWNIKERQSQVSKCFPFSSMSGWDAFLEESTKALPVNRPLSSRSQHHCLWATACTGELGSNNTQVTQRSVPPSPSSRSCHAQGRSGGCLRALHPKEKAVPESSWECSEIDRAAGKTRKRGGLEWWLPVPK